MKPHFTASASPDATSATGSPAIRSRSQITPGGSLTHRIACSGVDAVLLPTAASTMPSTVVGTCSTGTPRSQVAAMKPPTSVVAPPPKVTTASDRVKPALPSWPQASCTAAVVLAAFPLGRTISSNWKLSASAARNGSANALSAPSRTRATRCGGVDHAASWVAEPRPSGPARPGLHRGSVRRRRSVTTQASRAPPTGTCIASI